MAAILFTSGTTDQPKGVRLTHANLVANTIQTRHWIQELNYGRETCLSVVPLTHSYGMTNAMNIPIALGATIVLLLAQVYYFALSPRLGLGLLLYNVFMIQIAALVDQSSRAGPSRSLASVNVPSPLLR